MRLSCVFHDPVGHPGLVHMTVVWFCVLACVHIGDGGKEEGNRIIQSLLRSRVGASILSFLQCLISQEVTKAA